MGSTFARVKVWVSGEILTASDQNGEFDNILDNLTPAGIDDASTDLTAMRAVTDPGEVGTESLATSLEGEIRRLRNIIKEITGEAQWYVTPSDTLLTAGFASGTKLYFPQVSAPTGWTKDVDVNDSTIRIVSGGTGGSVGGSDSISSPPTHVHTGPSHTHTANIGLSGTNLGIDSAATSGTFTETNSTTANATSVGNFNRLLTNAGGTASTGTTTGFSPKYQDTIKATKD